MARNWIIGQMANLLLKLNTRFAYLPTFTRTPGGSFPSLSEVKAEVRRNSYFFLFPSLTAIAQSATAVYFFLILVATVRPATSRTVSSFAPDGDSGG